MHSSNHGQRHTQKVITRTRNNALARVMRSSRAALTLRQAMYCRPTSTRRSSRHICTGHASVEITWKPRALPPPPDVQWEAVALANHKQKRAHTWACDRVSCETEPKNALGSTAGSTRWCDKYKCREGGGSEQSSESSARQSFGNNPIDNPRHNGDACSRVRATHDNHRGHPTPHTHTLANHPRQQPRKQNQRHHPPPQTHHPHLGELVAHHAREEDHEEAVLPGGRLAGEALHNLEAGDRPAPPAASLALHQLAETTREDEGRGRWQTR